MNKEVNVSSIIEIIRQGGVVAVPTDTVYGLLADATNERAVEKIFMIKGREEGKPLPIFVRDATMAEELAHISEAQKRFLENVWPGKVTVVLKSRGALPLETGTTEAIGLRIPKHAFIRMLLEELNVPLTGTSANRSGAPPITDSKQLPEEFRDSMEKPDYIVQGGILPESLPSTVVDFREEIPIILRQGAAIIEF